MKYAVTLTNGVTGYFEADTEEEALQAAQLELERYSDVINQPIPDGLEPVEAKVIEHGA